MPFNVTGPCLIYVGLGASAQPLFLGTAQRCPRFSIQPYWIPLRRDDYGSQVPWDLLYDSEEAWIYAELNYFSERVLEAVQDRLYVAGSPLPLRGFHTEDAVGTLARGEGKTYSLVLSFPYARKLINVLGGMPANFVFPACASWGPDDHDVLGTHQPRSVRLLWRALRQHDTTPLVGDSEEVDVPAVQMGDSMLYYHDPFIVLPPSVG